MDDKKITLQIIAMEKAALEEWNKGNPSEFLKLLATDITYFDPFQEKRIDGYENMYAFYESLRGSSHVERYEMIDPVVQTYGNCATLSYNLYSYSGSKLFKWNCTEVYIQEKGGDWKIIHNHWSFIRPMDMVI